jgi:hypothetical protein
MKPTIFTNDQFAAPVAASQMRVDPRSITYFDRAGWLAQALAGRRMR